MDKKLHSFLHADQHSTSLPDPHHRIQQSAMEQEFLSELALLKAHKLNPRPEAIANLLQIIAHSDLAQQH
jgi:hypothetical protein